MISLAVHGSARSAMAELALSVRKPRSLWEQRRRTPPRDPHVRRAQAWCTSNPPYYPTAWMPLSSLEYAARAGVVHTQVVCAVAVDGQRLGFPGGARAPPPAYQALADRCMDTNPAARPTFSEALALIRSMRAAHPALRRAPAAQAAPARPGGAARRAQSYERLAPGGRLVPNPDAASAAMSA